MKQCLLCFFVIFLFAKCQIAAAQFRISANNDFNWFNATALKTTIIDNNDTVVFDLSQATCVGQYFLVPVSFISDDVINAVDFSMKYNNTKITYNSVVNYRPAYLTPSANFNTTDSILRFTSYSFLQAIDHNVAIAAVKFNLLNGPITTANFNTVKAYLNGDKCAFKFIEAVLPTAVISPSGPTTFITGDSVSLTANAGTGFTYLWSTASTKQTIKVFTAATYTVTVTNAGGCTANTAATVIVSTPLPVELLSFNVSANQAGINLLWATTSENSNSFFTIEHSVNAINWQELTKVYSKVSTNNISNYSYFDSNPVSGINYYRLKQTDINGLATYLSVRKISYQMWDKDNFEISVFPNPANSYISIQASENAIAQLYNLDGKAMGTPLILTAAVNNQMNIKLFPVGIYTLKIQAAQHLKTEKIVIVH